jgi:hypothetical protein
MGGSRRGLDWPPSTESTSELASLTETTGHMLISADMHIANAEPVSDNHQED